MSDLYIVVYDFASRTLRERCMTICLDAGLSRVQLSVFCGRLPGGRRKRLENRLLELMEYEKDKVGSISVLPLMSSAADQLFCIHNPSGRSRVCHPVEALREKKVRDFTI